MRQKDDRGSLYLLTALVLGIILGLIYGWWIDPVYYTTTDPKLLRSDFKDRYRALIATAFLVNQDIGLAQKRLELLGDEDSVVALTLQAQRAIAENRSEAEIQALSYLMMALSQGEINPNQLPILPTPTFTTTTTSTITPTKTPIFTATPVIQPESQATASILTSTVETKAPSDAITETVPTEVVFALYEQTLICTHPQNEPLLQIETLDTLGNPVPGVEILIRRKDNEDAERFFTGLKPDVGLGYADFIMLPDVSYLLWLGEGEQPVELAPPICETDSGSDVWGIWKLIFIQP